MTMGLEPMWTSLSDMLVACTDEQLLKWKRAAENPRNNNFKFITSLRQLVVHMHNKSSKDIINELSTAVNDEINSRNIGINMDKKLELRTKRLEKLLAIKNENMNLNNLAKHIKTLLNQHKILADKIKVYHDDGVEVTLDWKYDYKWFMITPNKDGGFTVEDENFTEKFDTIQQVIDFIDYLAIKDSDDDRYDRYL